ncbi:MAG: integrase core domain-containing protein, partial [Candidatus Ratteibacteria bacterium]
KPTYYLKTAELGIKLLEVIGGIKVEEKIFQTDNGIEQYWTRERRPKDNAEVERFIKTREVKFLNLGNYTDDVEFFNKNMVEYLIEYNFKRPHQALGYDIPINFLLKKFEGKVLPMFPNCA